VALHGGEAQTVIDVAVVAVYLVFILGIGLWAGRQLQTLEQYAVVGRSFGPLVIFATMSASFIGGGFSTGNAQKVFLFGVANVVGLWGFSLKEVLVARFVAPKMDRSRRPSRLATSWRPPTARSARS
jgi:SSS family solute:Na+ symporter